MAHIDRCATNCGSAGELTDDDLDQIDGRSERLVGKVQERYGKTEQDASEEVEDFFDRLEERVSR